MRALALTAGLFVLAACGGGASDAGTTAPAAGATALRIEFRERQGATLIVRTLRCAPPGGTLARPGVACLKLAALPRPFAPTPKDTACTEIYGGPQTAHVTGTFRGRRIDARFSRVDGCAIERWTKHAFLFPPVGRGPS